MAKFMEFFSNKKSDVDDAMEAIKAGYAELQKRLEERDIEVENLKSRIAELEGKQDVPVTPAPVEDATPAPEEPKPEVQPAVCGEELKALLAAVEELKAQGAEAKARSEEIKELVSRRDILDENMRTIHKEMEQYKGDFYAKVTKPYLVALLDLHYRFFSSARPYVGLEEQEGDLKENYKKLMEQFQVAIKAISDRVYNDFGIEDFIPQEGDAFDAKAHQIMETVVTNESETHRTIAGVICGGFRDMETLKIIRPARVSCYKYVEDLVIME